ncbi:MAG: DUF2760 domain-containing protein [Myxococcota bacterium]|nr:DUF2760 domain-containing protein [Myxococcota bacterium]
MTHAPSEDPPSLPARVWLAFVALVRVLFDARFATNVARLCAGRPALPSRGDGPHADESVTAPAAPRAAAAPVVLREPTPEAAAQLLAMLQREGRFVDFLEEDVAGFSDAEIGAAARVVHDGCRKVVRAVFDPEPVRTEPEGSRIRVERGFDAARLRLVGQVHGEPPFEGTLRHRGWQARRIELPRLLEGHDPRVIAPAEVEL